MRAVKKVVTQQHPPRNRDHAAANVRTRNKEFIRNGLSWSAASRPLPLRLQGTCGCRYSRALRYVNWIYNQEGGFMGRPFISSRHTCWALSACAVPPTIPAQLGVDRHLTPPQPHSTNGLQSVKMSSSSQKDKNKRIYCRLKSPSQQRIYQHESNLLLFFSFFKILNLCLLSIFSPRKKNGKRENRTSAIGGRACNLFKKIGCGHGQYSDRWWTALCAHQSTQKSASISVLIH